VENRYFVQGASLIKELEGLPLYRYLHKLYFFGDKSVGAIPCSQGG
jgi:hypothetical protein